MKLEKVNVQEIVQEVRKKFERAEIEKSELVRLYSIYNPNVDSSIFVEEAIKIFPKLNCGLASVYLQELLGGEIVRGYYDGYPHTYLLLSGQVIDVTSDQYGGPKVYVGELKLPWTKGGVS